MRSIKGYFLFELGRVWQLLDLNAGQPLGEQVKVLQTLISYLKMFIADERNKKDLPDSLIAAKVLIDHLEELTKKPDSVVTSDYISQLKHILSAFNDRMFNELQKVHVWVLEEKGPFGINTLWNNPLKLVGNAIPQLSDFVIDNISEAAKCLLLDRFTAVGFHAMRSVERVARKYHELITSKSPPYIDGNGKEYFKTLGVIANELKDVYVSLKGTGQGSGQLELIVGNLIPLNNLYRKTLAHTEIEKLDEDRAINALIQATDVIGTMVRDATSIGATHFKKPWQSGDKF